MLRKKMCGNHYFRNYSHPKFAIVNTNNSGPPTQGTTGRLPAVVDRLDG